MAATSRSEGVGSGESEWFIVGLSKLIGHCTVVLTSDCLRMGNLREMAHSPGREKGWLDPRETRFDNVIPSMLVS